MPYMAAHVVIVRGDTPTLRKLNVFYRVFNYSTSTTARPETLCARKECFRCCEPVVGCVADDVLLPLPQAWKACAGYINSRFFGKRVERRVIFMEIKRTPRHGSNDFAANVCHHNEFRLVLILNGTWNTLSLDRCG